MTYYGIPNLNYYENHFINDLNLFPNISEEILLNNIATKKNYDISINNEEKVHLDSINYDPIPILFQHRNNYMLKDIWKNINHGVTNRASKRSLIYSIERVNVEKKWIEFDNDEHDKMIYLIYKKSDIVGNVPTYNKFEINLLASTLVFNNLINHSHTIYKYMKSYNEALRCFEHYTCEIDGFVKTEINNETVYKPVAFKTMENSGNKPMDIDNVWDGAKINIAVQCKLSDVNNVIFGFRYNSKMELKYYDIPTIINGVEYKINKAFKRMKDNTAKIVHHCKRSQFLSLHDQHQL